MQRHFHIHNLGCIMTGNSCPALVGCSSGSLKGSRRADGWNMRMFKPTSWIMMSVEHCTHACTHAHPHMYTHTHRSGSLYKSSKKLS